MRWSFNLVNHIFPSGGVSGISYTTWRMHKLGVSSARSTFAQVIRYVTGFLSLFGFVGDCRVGAGY